MQLTLLELVQDMLSAVDAENVSSVSDTEEATMCVNIANRSFEEMIAVHKRWRHLRTHSALSASTYLNDLALPSGTLAVDPYNIYYNGSCIPHLSPEEFLSLTIKRDTTESTIESINSIKVYNDRVPQYFTSFDDETLTFDAIPNNVSGLNSALSLGLMYIAPTSRLTTDAQVFDLPSQVFPALDMYCVAKATAELKGDTQAAVGLLRQYKALMANLARTSRVIDKRNDLRGWIVPRRGSVFQYSSPRNTGYGFIL
tara:strand:- start:4490 stop:5257 length:768 start_codon:yes stop_codon:yes gene_type:complete